MIKPTNGAPDWPTLWTREPALRPERIGAVILDDEAGWQLRDDTPERHLLRPEHAAALCRDAAVRWLRNQRSVILCRNPGAPLLDGTYPADGDATAIYLDNGVVYGVDPIDPRKDRFHGDTLDAAIFAACAVVLDARDAKTPTRASA